VLIGARLGWGRLETEALPLSRFVATFNLLCPRDRT